MTDTKDNPPSAVHLRVAPALAQEEEPYEGGAVFTPDFWELIYGALFHPVRTLTWVNGLDPYPKTYLFYGAGLTVLLSALCAIARWIFSGERLASLGIQLPLLIAIGLAGWLIIGLLMATLSFVFTNQTRLRRFLLLSALSGVPWLLLPPIALLRTGLGDMGEILAGLAYFGLWLWTTTLYTMAVAIVYDMTAVRVLLFFGLPMLGFGLFLALLIPAMIASILGWMV